MGQKTKVTIYDLAKALNTTASTVSRALQDHPRISKKTKEAVQKLAKELNYQPDPIAHQLRTGKGLVIGVIVPRIDRNFFASVIGGIQAIAQQSRYSVIISQSNESYQDEVEAVHSFMNKKVDGLAISISAETTDYSHLERFAATNTPIVYFDRIPQLEQIDFVEVDNFNVGYQATKHLIEQGCKRIVHFAGPQTLLGYQNRLKGYQQALNDFGLPFNATYVIPNTITMDSGMKAAKAILQWEVMPDGIFSSGDYSAVSAIDYFKSQGVGVPDDIAVVGLANEPFVSYLSPSLSSVEMFTRKLGQETARLLLNRIESKDLDAQQTQSSIIASELIIRNSSRKK